MLKPNSKMPEKRQAGRVIKEITMRLFHYGNLRFLHWHYLNIWRNELKKAVLFQMALTLKCRSCICCGNPGQLKGTYLNMHVGFPSTPRDLWVGSKCHFDPHTDGPVFLLPTYVDLLQCCNRFILWVVSLDHLCNKCCLCHLPAV